jgi:hypothetical protein
LTQFLEGNREAHRAVPSNARHRSHVFPVREEILNGLINDKSGQAQISTAMRVLAEVIASDAAWLVAVNRAMDGVMESKGAKQSESFAHAGWTQRGLVNSLTGTLQRFGFEEQQ